MRTIPPYVWLPVLLCLLVVGCLIPKERTTLIRPGGTVRVLEAATGEPIEGVRIVLRRYRVGPPPRIETHSWSAATNAQGEASFELEEGDEEACQWQELEKES